MMGVGRNKRYKAVVIGVSVIAMIGMAAWWHLAGQTKRNAPLKAMPEHVDVQVKNVVYTDVGAEGAKWEVRADLGTFLKKDNKVLLDNVTVTLVMPDGRVFKMTGDKGVIGTESKDMNLSGHVTIFSPDGDRITMDNLRYAEKEKRFKSESLVVQENNRMKIQGRGMELSLKTQQLKLLSEVKAMIK